MADTCEHDWNTRTPDDSPTWRELVYRLNRGSCMNTAACTAEKPCGGLGSGGAGCEFWIDSGAWRRLHVFRNLRCTYLECTKCGCTDATSPPDYW